MTDLVRLEELGPAQRVERYLDRLAKSRQHDPNDIHGFDVGEPSEVILKAADLRALIQLLKDREGALQNAAEYLCRLEGALIADDLDMKLSFPGEPSPTALAETILPGFDAVEYDLSRQSPTGEAS